MSSYKTLYYDTPDYKSYIEHHNGKLNRIKIRFREYIDTGLTFLEVKLKNNKEKTVKSRVKRAEIEEKLSSFSKDYIEKHSFYNANELQPTLWNRFSRITLVHKVEKERLTIDLNLKFQHYQTKETIPISYMIIAEVKQAKKSVNSDFIQVMKNRTIRPTGVSKCCIANALLNKELKANNFKQRILKVKKLENVRSTTA